MRGRLLHATASVTAAVACGALLAGCGGSGGSSAAAPTTTVAVGSTAATVTAPATTAPATTAPAEPVAAGRVAQGKEIFATHCDTCHAGLGTRKYIGPRLAGQELGAGFIRNRVIQGKSPMPAGLVSGQDLADVVAFVRSIQ